MVASPVTFASQLGIQLAPNEKIFGLSSIWMEIRRNFPDKSKLGEIDSLYCSAITKVANTADNKTYYLELQKFVASVGDGHTFIILPKNMMSTRSRPPLGVIRVGNLAMVSWIRNDLQSEIPLGSIVLGINGEDFDKVAKGAAEYVTASSEHVRLDKAYTIALDGDSGSAVSIFISLPDGTKKSVELIRGQSWPENTFGVPILKEVSEEVSLNWLVDKKIGLVKIKSFSNDRVYDQFRKILPDLQSAKVLMLDLRDNRGGNDSVAFQILGHFITKPVKSSASRKLIYDPEVRAQIARSDDFLKNLASDPGAVAVDIPPEMISRSDPAEHISANIIILTNHGTISAAEDFLVAADEFKYVKIGSTTAGSTGEPISIPLPGGGEAYILSKLDYYPDGRKFVGTGIAPDIEIDYDVLDYRKGRDPVVEKALEVAKSKLEAEPPIGNSGKK